MFVFGVTLGGYSLTTAPHVHAYDSAELTLGAYSLGIVHAPGYSLYLLLAHGFGQMFPALEYAHRINWFSAWMGAFAALSVYGVGERLTRSALPAVGAALMFAFAPRIWEQATAAEVYTLHLALMGGGIWAALMWHQTRRIYWALWAALLHGLAIAHHPAAVLISACTLPPLLWTVRRWRWRAALCILIGLPLPLLALYLPLRFEAQPAFNLLEGYFLRDLSQPEHVLWMLRGGMFADRFLALPPLAWLRDLARFSVELFVQFAGVGVLVGVLGWQDLWTRQRALSLILAAVFALQVIFFSSYDVFDKWTMFHSAYWAWAIAFAVGLHALLAWIPRRWLMLGTALLVSVHIAAHGWYAGNLRNTRIADQTRALLAQLPPDTLLIAPWTTLRPIDYFQLVHGERRDVRTLDFTLLSLGLQDQLQTTDRATLTQAASATINHAINCAQTPVVVVEPFWQREGYTYEWLGGSIYRVIQPPDCPAR